MIEPTNEMDQEEALSKENDVSTEARKGPFSFLSGAMTSGLLALLCFRFSKQVVIYFARHSPDYDSAIVQSIASGFKTLVIGVSFLATFTFAFIGLGLTLVFFRSLFAVMFKKSD